MKINRLKPRWHKVLIDFWENKARLALVIASIAVGVYAAGLINITAQILPENLQTVYQDSIPANIIITTNGFDQDLIDVVSRVKDVDLVEGRRTFTLHARVIGEDHWQDISLSAADDLQDQELKRITLQDGTFPSKEGDILMLAEALNDFPVEPGSLMEIKLQDDTIRTVTVSGIAKDYTAGIENTINRRVAFIDSDNLDYFHTSSDFNTLYVAVAGDSTDTEHIQEIANVVKEKVKDTGHIVYSQQIQASDEHPYGNYIDAVAAILDFVGILIVILGSFLVINTMNAIITEHTRQIGVMKLIGAQSRDIIKMYTILVLLFGIVAFVISVPLSSYSAYMLSNHIATILNGKMISSNRFPIVPSAILMQAVIAFVVPILASILPILQGAKTSVQHALHSNLIEVTTENTRLDRLINKVKNISGLMLLAMRNTFRRKSRLALTLITLSLGGSIFIGVFNVKAMLNEHIVNLTNYCAADIFLTFDRSYPIDEINSIAGQIDGINHVEGWKTFTGILETDDQLEQVIIEAPPDDSQMITLVQTGRWVEPDEDHTIVINEGFYKNFPDLKTGDSIILNINGKDETFTVVGIFNYIGLSSYKRAYINYTTATEITGNWSKTNNYRVKTERKNLDSTINLVDVINETFQDRGYDVSNVSSVQAIVNESGEKLNLVITVLLILAILTGLVGSIGLSGTLSLNVLERTSEIGILRAVGSPDKAISKLVIYEGLFTGLVSYLIGTVVSFPVSLILGNMVNQAIFKSNAVLTINPAGFMIWLVLVIIMSITASLIPARNATHLTIREVLAYE